MVEYYHDRYDQGRPPDLEKEKSVHTVAALLKLWLRQLPEPVIPFTFFDDFMRLNRDTPEAEVTPHSLALCFFRTHRQALGPTFDKVDEMPLANRILLQVRTNFDRHSTSAPFSTELRPTLKLTK